MSSNPSGATRPAQTKSGKLTQYFVYGGILLLFLIGLILPPVRLISRIANIGYTEVGANGATLSTDDGGGVILAAPNSGTGYVKLNVVPLERFEDKAAGSEMTAAREALPSNLEVKSAVYQLSKRGAAPASADALIPIPSGAEPKTALDVYAWDGTSWVWVPTTIRPTDRNVVAHTDGAPECWALMLTNAAVQTSTYQPGAAITAGSASAPKADCGLAPVTLLADVGSATGAMTLPLVTTVGANGTADPQIAATILASTDLAARHASAIADAVNQTNARGVVLDYRGLDASLRSGFLQFVTEVRSRLQGKTLIVRVPAAQQSGDSWDTGAYDWAKLGELADSLVIIAPDDPRACAPERDLAAMLAWATGQVNRSKLAVAFNARSEDLAADKLAALVAAKDALAPLGKVTVKGGTAEVLPGQSVILEAGARNLQLDPKANAYYYEYSATDGSTHTVWLEDNTTLTRKLVTVTPYRVGQVFLLGVDSADQNTQQMLQTLAVYAQAQIGAARSDASVIWTVQNSQGTPVAQSTRVLSDTSFSYSSNDPGIYGVSAGIAMGQRVVSTGKDQLPVKVVTLTPTPTPTPKATPTPTATNTPEPTEEPTAGPVAPSGGTGFGYGIQVHFIYQSNHAQITGAINQMGFGWVKQQVEWAAYETSKGQYSLGELDRLVNDCSAAGLKILLSVVKAPMWARPADTDKTVAGPPANPQDYADFVGMLAARYAGRVQAFEVWNEQNLYYEWGGRGNRLSAAAYVNLLKVAYAAIKANNPSATVVSGALTPTGWSDYDTAVDDAVYLEEMYLHGLANYCDAVGVHPSGYNNPPDAGADYTNPAEPGNKGHRSWFFRATMERYREIMVAYGDSWKRLWPTEFGWASVENMGAAPVAGYEYAANNTEAEQAAYIVRAYEIARNWGWVGPMFLWNLNFAPVAGNADEKAAFGIVRADWSARPAYTALVNMAK